MGTALNKIHTNIYINLIFQIKKFNLYLIKLNK